MTTIAYKDGVLAADSGASVGNYIIKTTKLVPLPDGGAVACAGAGPIGQGFIRWILGGRDEDERPVVESGDEFSAIHMVSDGIFVYMQDTQGPTHTSDPFAIGSGCDFAIAAMHLGATAEEAVELACELDIYCSLPVLSHKYEPAHEIS
jgi:20S proteasome alpha/beta subunit